MININLQDYLGNHCLYNQTDLTLRIIEAIKNNEKLNLKTKEGPSFIECRLYELLDEICDFYNYDKSNISIESNNWNEYHAEYNVRRAPFHYELSYFDKENDQLTEYSNEKFYGMFIGRANKNRIRSLILSKRTKIPCITSFTDDINPPILDRLIDIGNLLYQTDTTFQEINEIKPYSEIEEVINPPPIISPENSYGEIWKNTYQKIAIEIVNETILYPNSFYITEKTMRPIYYKRPFIMIAAPGFLDNLRSLGFKTFDNLIPNHATAENNPDEAFSKIKYLYSRYTGKEILQICQDQLNHNYQLLIELGKQHKEISQSLDGYNYYDK